MIEKTKRKYSPYFSYLLDNLHKASREQAKSTKSWYWYLAFPFVITTTLALTILGTVSIALLFNPAAWVLGLVAISGLILDYIMFSDSVNSTFRLMFDKGLFSDLDEYVVTRELDKQLQQELTNDDIEVSTTPMLTFLEQELKDKDEHERKHVLQGYYEKWLIYKKVHLAQARNNAGLTDIDVTEEQLEADWELTLGKLAQQDKRNQINPVLYVGLMIEKIRQEHHTELTSKKWLLGISLVSALISGLGFVAMTFKHVLAIATFTNPIALGFALGFGGLIAAVAGFTWGLMMYKNLHSAIKKNIFVVLYRKLGFERDDWDQLPWYKQMGHVCFCIAKTTISLAVAAIAFTVTVLSAAAYLDATVTCATWIAGAVSQGLFTAFEVLIYGIMLPATILFAIKHAVAAINKLIKGFAYLTSVVFSANDHFFSNLFESIKDNPLRFVLISIGTIFTLGALLVHFVSEAAFGAGEGADSKLSWPSKVFNTLAKWLGTDAVLTAVAASATIEGLVHSDFIMKQTGKDFIEGFYTVPAKVVSAIKGEANDEQESEASHSDVKPLLMDYDKVGDAEISENTQIEMRETYHDMLTALNEGDHLSYFTCFTKVVPLPGHKDDSFKKPRPTGNSEQTGAPDGKEMTMKNIPEPSSVPTSEDSSAPTPT